MNRALRVYFVYQTIDAPYGGANSFQHLLKTCFQNHPEFHVQCVSDPKQADLLLVNAASRGPHRTFSFSFRRLRFVRAIKDPMLRPWHVRNLSRGRFFRHPRGLLSWGQAPKIPIVHRLDGFTSYYGRKDGARYDQLQIRLNRLASATVFQSQFCKNLFSPFINPSTPSAVLFNGTDGNIFKWVDRRKPRGKIAVLAASWSSNLRKGHGELKKLSSLPSVEVTYVGRWPMDLNPGNIRILSPIPQQDLANLMTRFHIFAHFSDRDTSPNIVVEALATGLPVLYKHSGGTPEIVEEQRFGESIENNAKLQEERMTTALENLILRYDDIISEIKKERNRFLIETTARCYSHIFHTTAGDKLC